jgi:hypothetical protein
MPPRCSEDAPVISCSRFRAFAGSSRRRVHPGFTPPPPPLRAHLCTQSRSCPIWQEMSSFRGAGESPEPMHPRAASVACNCRSAGVLGFRAWPSGPSRNDGKSAYLCLGQFCAQVSPSRGRASRKGRNSFRKSFGRRSQSCEYRSLRRPPLTGKRAPWCQRRRFTVRQWPYDPPGRRCCQGLTR